MVVWVIVVQHENDSSDEQWQTFHSLRKKSSSAPSEKSFVSETFHFDRLVCSDSYLSCFSMQVTGRSFFFLCN